MNLGDAAWAAGDTATARVHYARAVAILEEASPSNPELARFLDRLARAILLQGDAEAARPLYERSLALREKVLGPAHHEVGESLAGLAECTRRQGRAKEAEALFERSLALSRRAAGGYYPQAAETLRSYAALLRETGQKARAEQVEGLAAAAR
jgi:tetratricopeptide (TPR) repeat protein